MSSIITFYSYKGGVGRTMALANVAVLMAQWGLKVLIIDWDIEAPGLEHFFKKDFGFDINTVAAKGGVIDLLGAESSENWQDLLLPVTVPKAKHPIHMISAGRRNDEYFKKVRQFSVDDFYENGGGLKIETLRDEWKEAYDFILVDSRTGVTEIGGICTIQLPDKVVLLFTATDQGFDGTLDIAKRAILGQQKLPFDREKLVFVPIPTKFDTVGEFALSQQWLNHFAEKLTEIYADWLPKQLDIKDFLEITKIPYKSYFSFGEKLPVIEQGVHDPTGLGYAYESLAALLANNLERANELVENRQLYIRTFERDKNTNDLPSSSKKINIYIDFHPDDREIKQEILHHLLSLKKHYNVEFWDEDQTVVGIPIHKQKINAAQMATIIAIIVTDKMFQKIPVALQISNENKFIIPVYCEDISIKYPDDIHSNWSNSIFNLLIADYPKTPRLRTISSAFSRDKAIEEVVTAFAQALKHLSQ